jgi:hypothetical protein
MTTVDPILKMVMPHDVREMLSAPLRAGEPFAKRANLAYPKFDDARLCQLLKSALGLRYNLRAGRFEFRAPGQIKADSISDAQLMALISRTLAQRPDLSPPSQLRPRRMKRLIVTLRAICADAGDAMVLAMRQFVQTRLVRQAGCDLTSTEVRAAYRAHTRATDGAELSAYEFQRQLPALIKDSFGISTRHDVKRPAANGVTTYRRGYRGIAIKSPPVTDATDATDAADATLNFPQPSTEHVN